MIKFVGLVDEKIVSSDTKNAPGEVMFRPAVSSTMCWLQSSLSTNIPDVNI